MPPILLVSLNGACTTLETYPGEIFEPTTYDFCGLSTSEFRCHSKHWHGYAHRVCVMALSFGRYDQLDLSMFDTVIVLDQETINGDPQLYHSKLCKTFDNDNIFIVSSGYDLDFALPDHVFYLLPFFALRIAHYNQIRYPASFRTKNKIFDALLGMQKLHRDIVFYELAKHDLLHRCLINYTTNQWHDTKFYTIYRSPELNHIDQEQTMPNGVFNSYAYLEDRGYMLSHDIPWTIYDRTWFSIVAETDYTSHCFMSEKTAKCFMAGRIFVLFAGRGLLSHCRKLGFRTFDEIFDEGYDMIADTPLRCKTAFQQVLWLVQQNPVDVYRAAAPILQHNQRHIQNRDYFIGPLKSWINSLISRHA